MNFKRDMKDLVNAVGSREFTAFLQSEQMKSEAPADQWRARFEWLAMQYWVESEAIFRFEIQETDADDSAGSYMAQLISAVDAMLLSNAKLTGTPETEE